MDELTRFAVDITTGYLAERALEPVLEPAWRVVRSIVFPRWGEATGEARLQLKEHFDELRARGAVKSRSLCKSYVA